MGIEEIVNKLVRTNRLVRTGAVCGALLALSSPVHAEITKNSPVVSRVHQKYLFDDFEISPKKDKFLFRTSIKVGEPGEIYIAREEYPDYEDGGIYNVSNSPADDKEAKWINNDEISFWSDRSRWSKFRREYLEYRVMSDGSNLRCVDLEKTKKQAINILELFGALALGSLSMYKIYNRYSSKELKDRLGDIVNGAYNRLVEHPVFPFVCGGGIAGPYFTNSLAFGNDFGMLEAAVAGIATAYITGRIRKHHGFQRTIEQEPSLAGDIKTGFKGLAEHAKIAGFAVGYLSGDFLNGFSTYLGLSLIRDCYYKERGYVLPLEGRWYTKAKHAVLNSSRPVAVGWAGLWTGTALGLNLPPYFPGIALMYLEMYAGLELTRRAVFTKHGLKEQPPRPWNILGNNAEVLSLVIANRAGKYFNELIGKGALEFNVSLPVAVADRLGIIQIDKSQTAIPWEEVYSRSWPYYFEINKMYPAIICTIGAYFLSDIALTLTHSDSLSLLKSSWQSRFAALRKDYDSAIQRLEGILEQPASQQLKSDILSRIGNLYQKSGDHAAAMARYVDSAALSTKETKVISPFEVVTGLFSLDKAPFMFKSRKLCIEDRINRALMHMRHRNFSNAKYELQIAENQESNNIDLFCFHAYALDLMKDPRAEEKWQRAISLVQQDPNARDVFRSIEGKEVYQITTSQFLENAFVFKKGERNALEDEYRLTLSFYEKGRAVEPIDIIEAGGDYFLITMHAPGERLFDYLQRTSDADALAVPAGILAWMHAGMPAEGMQSRAYREEFERRLEAKDPRLNGIRDKIRENISATYEFEWLPLVFDRDAHPYNWFIDKGGHIIALDIENRGLSPPVFDLAKLFFQGKYIPANKEGDQTVAALSTLYFEEFNEHSQRKIGDRHRFSKAVLQGCVSRAISYHCSAFSNPHTEEARYGFLRHGLHATERLIDEFKGSFSDSQLRQLDELRDAAQLLVARY